jgi:tetratricopeptide (TPR) repeat protein
MLQNELCWTRAMVGDLAAALANCNTAIQTTLNDAAPYDSRGLVYLKMSQWDSAIADYTAALKIDPKLPSGLYGRGFAELKKGDARDGSADIAAATAISPKIAEEFAGYGIK